MRLHRTLLVRPSAFVLLGFGALVLAGCSPSTNGNNAAPENSSQNGNSSQANEAVSNAAIVPSTTSTPTSTERARLLSNVWVPGKDDKLHLRPVSKAALEAQKKFGNPTEALADIVRMAPKWFPPKTRVMQWSDNGQTISVNLNRNFATSEFWSKSGSKTTQLAVYALVNSASVDEKPVVLQVEKRPVTPEEMGGFDTSDAIEPNLQLQAKTGSSSSSATSSSVATPSPRATTQVPAATPNATTSAALNALPDADFSAPTPQPKGAALLAPSGKASAR